jgi:hypothetical protein
MNGFDVPARHPGAVRPLAVHTANRLPHKGKLPDIIDLDLR